MKTIFTTGQVARLCKVAPRTVTKWFDTGSLRGYRIPGSQDRRIPRENLIRFLKEHGMPLGELEAVALGKVLLVDVNPHLMASLASYLDEDSFKLDHATNSFEAGIKARSMMPDCVVLDSSVSLDAVVQISRSLKHGPDNADVILIGMLNPNDRVSDESLALFAETFRKPADAAKVAARIWDLVRARKPLIV
ncbi:MAG: helix-turn-helix domain-containing protein [Planctomycetales bacterium]|nr:helix-turn-helix domain-containing protein [Planctomycetales bacterium]